jgi:hypothetical protein
MRASLTRAVEMGWHACIFIGALNAGRRQRRQLGALAVRTAARAPMRCGMAQGARRVSQIICISQSASRIIRRMVATQLAGPLVQPDPALRSAASGPTRQASDPAARCYLFENAAPGLARSRVAGEPARLGASANRDAEPGPSRGEGAGCTRSRLTAIASSPLSTPAAACRRSAGFATSICLIDVAGRQVAGGLRVAVTTLGRPPGF